MKRGIGFRLLRRESGEYIDLERLRDLAYGDFCGNLERLRRIVPVKTICMHGSPMSRVSNLDLWKRYDYRELGIVGEPYLDFDFNQMFYLTDTGRRWDGWKVSVRDKMPQQEEWIRQGLVFHSTWDIIRAVEVPDVRSQMSDVRGQMSDVGTRRTNRGVDGGVGVTFPHKVMMTVHPQRWTDDPFQWTKELVLQNVKNVVKRFVLQNRTKEAKGMSG
jgi:hypothetical protein